MSYYKAGIYQVTPKILTIRCCECGCKNKLHGELKNGFFEVEIPLKEEKQG